MNNRLRNRWIKWLFPIFALLLLLPWPIAYANDINAEASEDSVQIEIAESSAKPGYTAFGSAIGGVDPGDLFYINANSNAADIVVTLSMTNIEELINHYRFMMLKVGVYVESDGEWVKASGSNGELISDTILLSMRNGQVSFLLPGYAKYKVTIDGGSFYCTNANDDGGIAPQLYLEVN